MSSPRSILISQLVIILLTSPWSLSCQRYKRQPPATWLEITGGSANANHDIHIPNSCGPIGRYTATYLDVGGALEHSNGEGVTYVAGGGYVTTLKVSEPRWMRDTVRGHIPDTRTITYLQGKVRVDYDYFGLETGLFGVSDSLHDQAPFLAPALRVRIGAADGIYFSAGTMRSPAYLASGAVLDMGFGFPVKEIRTNFWLGMGYHPQFTNGQLIAEAQCQVTNNLAIKGSFNSGALTDALESHVDDPRELGFSVGVRLKLQ